jgi:hypothetical protein
VVKNIKKVFRKTSFKRRACPALAGITVKLRVVLSIWTLEKVSPPFKGGVAGTTDYMIVTRFISRPGWLI